jgi:hypothetical protein
MSYHIRLRPFQSMERGGKFNSQPGMRLVSSPIESLAMTACRQLFHEEIVQKSAGPGQWREALLWRRMT